MILLDDKHALIEYHQTDKCIYYAWKTFVPSSILRENLQKIIVWAEEYKAIALINNAKEIGVIGTADQDWLADQFAIRLSQSIIKYSAIILPVSVFRKLVSEEIIKKSASNDMSSVKTKYFDSKENVFAWVREVQK